MMALIRVQQFNFYFQLLFYFFAFLDFLMIEFYKLLVFLRFFPESKRDSKTASETLETVNEEAKKTLTNDLMN